MPELPEVESARCLVEAHCIGAKVTKVEFNEDGSFDEKIFKDVERKAFVSALLNKTLKAAHRRGKHMWWDMSGGADSPLFHFGMTGAFSIRGKGAMKYKAFVVDTSNWPPRFAKIRLHFDDGGELVMTNARRFGRIRLREDPVAEPPIGTLGFDPLLDLPDARAFGVLLESRPRITLKGLLLDQRFAAGVGNWIADEVLFQARLDPRRPVGSLGAGEVRRLRTQLGRVVRTAVAAGARSKRFPRNWLFHARWGRSKDAVLADGSPVRHLTVAGRTTAWVPSRQS